MSTADATTETKVIADLLTQRRVVQTQQTKLKNLIGSKCESMSLPELETRLSMLETYLTNFSRIQTQLECADAKEASNEKRETFEETYVEIKTAILREISKRERRVSVAVSATEVNKRKSLPKLQLSKFSGKYSEWPDFISMFSNLVHDDDTLSNIDKFQHLRSCLSGTALLTISSLENTDENYEKALELLKRRFDNKRLIFQEHISEIFNLKNVEKNSVQQLRSISDSVNAHLRALLSLGNKEQIADALLIHIIYKKLDFATQCKWEDEVEQDTLPSWDKLVSCIEKRCIALEHLEQSRKITDKNNQKLSGKVSLAVSNTKAICHLCNSSSHYIQNCRKFLDLSPSNRFIEVKRFNLCINCLRQGHNVKACKASNCRHCSFRHNTLLHLGSSSPNPIQEQAPQLQAANENIVRSSSTLTTSISSAVDSYPRKYKTYTYLPTALIEIADIYGKFIPCRAVLDSASQLNFITERMAQQLRLKKDRSAADIKGIGDLNTNVKYAVNVTIRSSKNKFSTSFEALVLPEIIGYQPTERYDISEWNIPANILQDLADPNFDRPQKVDLLIGAGLFFELLMIGQIRLGANLPVLQKTIFGWIVSGNYMNSSNKVSFTAATVAVAETERSLHEEMKKFWEIEGHEVASKELSKMEEACEEHFCQNHKRDTDGRYIVSLPFKLKASLLGNSFENALKRFYKLESKLEKNPEIYKEYARFMSEYYHLGHMQPINFEEIPPQHYFMPHHCVLKMESSSTKLRVVFDASCKTDTGYSLNDLLSVGPVIQDDLYSILLRFRTYRYALTGDITKMYRQVKVTEDDSFLQIIIWRENKGLPLSLFRLTTVTYGTSPASFLAIRCLQQLAQDEADKFPIGAKVLVSSFYVDDMLAGADSIEECKRIQTETEYLLKQGGFIMRKWCSNNEEVLSNVNREDREHLVKIDEDSIIRTLGLVWKPIDDQFRYIYSPKEFKGSMSKRSVLSIISRIFDPLGLISPVVVRAKIIMQKIWSLGLNWDESLPEQLEFEWRKFMNQLHKINCITIPRYVLSRNETKEIHGFADASKNAYGACVYVKTENSMGKISVNILTAKSRVAPLKSISTPRLELCAALLLAELLQRISDTLRIESLNVTCWTDSQVVLQWIKSDAKRWKPFVSNRVAKIQQLTSSFVWKYVPTQFNPADCISRGLSPEAIADKRLWFHGPEFLFEKETHFKQTSDASVDLTTECRKKQIALVVTTQEDDLIARCKFSNSFSRLRRTFAYLLRFYVNSKSSSSKLQGQLSIHELENAEKALIKMLQTQQFREEYKDLKNNKALKDNSPLKNLSPFMDEEGLLRVGGRLQHSSLEHDSRHPILLPKSHLFTKALISFYHFRYLHAGVQSLLSIIRTKYWPIGGKNSVKEVIHHCIRCFKFRPKSISQLMGQLPTERVQPSRPFYYTGIDFCGPFMVTELVRGRGPKKAYLCLFICFAVKAVHLELVSNLSTEAFLAALKRFIARRGRCIKIFSDNATNFVGARNQLKELYTLFLSDKHNELVNQFCIEEGIEWNFIPPRSPHFGGLWEASIKAAKHLIVCITANSLFTFEELNTIICEAEAVMNSRPIAPVSNDPNDFNALTPGHFLIGAPLKGLCEPDLRMEKLSVLTRWKRVSYVQQHFWSRWSNEYLQSLQQRNKWRTSSPNIKANTLVLIKEENLPPFKWALGRVLEVFHGADNRVRVATIKTTNGIIRRAITRLCPLPLDESSES